METRLLEYYLTVAREKNITRSAEILHITQPTLSRQLAQLEDDLGKQLIIRGKRGIELTEAGMLFRRRAEEILELVNKTEKEFSLEDEELIGEIAIGTAECKASYHFLPNIISSFHNHYSLVTYDLYTGEAELIKEKIVQGLLDVGILLEPVDIAEFDFVRIPYQDIWGLVVANNHPLAKKEFLTHQDLMKVPLFFNKRRTILRNELQSWAQGDYEKYQFIASYNLISNLVSLIKDNIGCALTIEAALTNINDDELKFIPLFPKIISNTVLVWKKHQILSPATKRFIEFIKQEI